MNKDQLIRDVAEALSMQKKDVKKVIEHTFSTITKNIKDGNAVQIVGFGTFEVRQRAERVGRNPQTGESINIPATKTPAFNPGKKLRDTIKGRL